MIRVELPWPPKDVSPNARGHWSKKARAVQSYRNACGWECVAQKVERIEANMVHARITFHAPDKRPRDLDNMLGCTKAGIDAVASMIGVDDSQWEITIARGAVKPHVGAVVMELEASQ